MEPALPILMSRKYLTKRAACLWATINIGMTKCCSQSRCSQLDCTACARRYAGRLAKRVQATASGKLFAIEMQLPSKGLADFWSFRIQCRNLVDHRRRRDFWWCSLLLHVWMGQDGMARGIESPGSLTSCEVQEAFQSRWPTTIRPLDSENLRSEIVQIVRPGLLPLAEMSARYQSLKLAIWPRREKSKVTPRLEQPRYELEPMPIVF
jgi:hypothetical protein